jgi:hypothetical protein
VGPFYLLKLGFKRGFLRVDGLGILALLEVVLKGTVKGYIWAVELN